MRKIILILSIVILIVACHQQGEDKQKEQTFGARQIRIKEAYRGDISSEIFLTGKLEAEKQVTVTTSLPVIIEAILVTEGQKVEKGQLLIKMDSSNLIQAKAQYENLQNKYRRMKKLADTDAVDKQSMEDVKAAFLAAEANYKQVKQNTHISTPISGIISDIAVKEGETFNTMSFPYLLRIVHLDNVIAKTNISDKDMVTVEVGQEVSVRVDSYPEKIFRGRVCYVAPEANNLSGTFPIEIEIENSEKLLRNNQMARICLHRQTAKNVIIIPKTAIIDENRVFVAVNGKAVEKKVQFGIENQDEIQVVSGIGNGELVIVEGNTGLLDGDKVKVIK
ncbi:MAG: efflux RND transporter periplasmic adaptor subunit [Candidatus Cloacimonadota bacterium]|nr:efflux RND transporter periplasmic adaptor subunit [Candidatus Cloacimonadota bacterium]